MTLTLEHAIRICPAIGATVPAEHVSTDYHFMPTGHFLKAFMDSGWEIATAKQINTRKRNPLFAKHLISMQHPSFGFTNDELGSIRPRLNIINSHDWSSRMQVLLGMFRLACTNGMVIETGWFTGLNVRHDADLGMTLDDITSRFTTESGKLIETSKRWRSIELSPDTRAEFLTGAGRIRWGDAFTGGFRDLDHARRHSDIGNDLWNTFNRVQENLMRGGGNFNGNYTARLIKNINAERNINTQLWNFADDLSNRRN